MAAAYVVLVTLPDHQTAVQLARTLVDEQLAACVNIVGGVQSIYRYQGALCDETEVLCLVKTTAARFAALRDRVVSLHPYDVPEVVALPIVAGHPPYLDWLEQAVDRETG